MLSNIPQSISKEITLIFQDKSIDPTTRIELCLGLLDKACASGELLDPIVEEKAQAACNTFGHIAQRFLHSGLSSAAIRVLVNAWHKFEFIQENEPTKIYKAGIAAYLAKVFQAMNDVGAAVRWSLITHAEDALGGNVRGAARDYLLQVFGVPHDALLKLEAIAASYAKDVTDWSESHAFADATLLHFALKHQEYADLFALPTQVPEFPRSEAYYDTLIELVDTKKVLADGQSHFEGKPLEDLASYLFFQVAGWVPSRNHRAPSYESDIVVSNMVRGGNLSAELFGRNFLVECKNKAKPIGSQEVGYFLYRMRLTHCKFGVIFAREDITGSDKVAATHMIMQAFHEDGSTCVVVNREDLDNLKHILFVPLLLKKSREAQFGVSIYK